MKIRQVLIILSIYLFPGKNTIAQKSDTDFLLEKIRKEYFKLGVESDSSKFEKYVSGILKDQEQDSLITLSNLTNYFRDQHLICYARRQDTLLQNIDHRFSIDQIKEKVKKHKYKYEGFWINDLKTDVIGIVLVDVPKKIYHGYLVWSTDSSKIGNLVLRFNSLNKKNTSCEYINPYFRYRQFSPLYFNSKDEIQVWSYMKWERIKNGTTDISSLIKPYSYTASLENKGRGIYVLKIPENSEDNIPVVDSLMKEFETCMDSAKVLIVDIRNNPGGTIRTYTAVLPFIYTNKILRPDGINFVSEDLLNAEKRGLEQIDSVKYPSAFDKQRKRVDSLVNLVGKTVITKGRDKVFDTVYKNPIRVGLLINYACMSAAEAMILDFKQSKKVVIFGENSAGAIDNLNAFALRLPSGNYSMWMPTFRTIPSATHRLYGGSGLSPDVRISKKISDWTQYAANYFETH